MYGEVPKPKYPLAGPSTRPSTRPQLIVADNLQVVRTAAEANEIREDLQRELRRDVTDLIIRTRN